MTHTYAHPQHMDMEIVLIYMWVPTWMGLKPHPWHYTVVCCISEGNQGFKVTSNSLVLGKVSSGGNMVRTHPHAHP
jgi:hypothetical protein